MTYPAYHVDGMILSHPRFTHQLTMMGVAVMVASVLYFIASNWFMLPHSYRIAIPMLLLLISAALSVLMRHHSTARQVADTISVMMIGLTLAVIGQAYQTGADSFWLFGIWTVLALPWLYRHNVGVFFSACITSLLTVWLFFTQMLWGEQSISFIIIVNAVLGAWLWATLRHYTQARYLMVALIFIFSLFCAVAASDTYADDFTVKLAAFISMLLLPALSTALFRQRVHQVATVLTLSGLGLSGLTWLIMLTNLHDSLFVMGLVILGLFFGVGYAVVHLFPKGKWHAIPVGLGAYWAGLSFAGATLTFWGEASLGLGLLTFIGALVLLYHLVRLPDDGGVGRVFVRQLAYCLMLCGQVAFLFHLLDKLGNALLSITILQAVLCAAVIWVRPHWLVVALQLFALYVLTCAYFLMDRYEHDMTMQGDILLILQLVFASVIFLLKTPKYIQPRAIWLLIFMVLSTTLAFNYIIRQGWQIDYAYQGVFNIIMSAWLIAVIYLFSRHSLTPVALIGALLAAVILAMMGQFALVLLVLGLAWAVCHKDKLIWAIYLVGLGVFLWHTYYSIETTFIIKSGIMMISGWILCLMAYIFKGVKLP